MTILTVPELSCVILIGASGSGKSSFARKHFKPTEVLSSDYCRGLVSDDENSQEATKDAFDVLHYIASKRLAAGRLTVIDATSVQPEARKPLVELARAQHMLPVAIVFDLPEGVCQARNRDRNDRDFGPQVVSRQIQQLRRSMGALKREGFGAIHVLSTPEEVDAASIARRPMWNDLKQEHGPFDIVGDIHGCLDELVELLRQLGYALTEVDGALRANPPAGRRAVFLGDLVDRGPNTPGVLRLVMTMVADGVALCVPGNHDTKLVRALRGKKVNVSHGLAESLAQLDGESAEFRDQAATFLDRLVSHYVLDDGKLVVAHAGMKQEMQGRGSAKVRDFALYGETTGETDEFGLPVRYNWAAEYHGRAQVVYGHTPIPQPEWLNRTINIDTGCVFGGKLTALRYPELELVAVPAGRVYAEPARPLAAAAAAEAAPLTAQQQNDDLLNIEDVLGKRFITTALNRNITIREENASAALEVMSRYAANPKWLIYLPPTMSPSETSKRADALEHPAEAFAYYRQEGVRQVVCEEKHMGSRAVVVVCQSEDVARARFGVVGEGIGICYTRTGRRFFTDGALEASFLDRIRSAVDRSALWDMLQTDWLCLDCELMPWSAKALELVQQQYAATGAAARAALAEAATTLEKAVVQHEAARPLLERVRARAAMAQRYTDAYRRYCWPVCSLSDIKLAPFHLLASEGAAHHDKDHVWHMTTLARLCEDPLLVATPFKVVDVTDQASEAEGVAWWEELTQRGGEGMVIKPYAFVAKGRRGLVQPAMKCRGREYLRLIYGPEYTAPENLERLRNRNVAGKRALAAREFALGMEALDRFTRREPLYRIHECVFGVLALESEPIDPRL